MKDLKSFRRLRFLNGDLQIQSLFIITKVIIRETGLINIVYAPVHCWPQVVFKYVFTMNKAPSVP